MMEKQTEEKLKDENSINGIHTHVAPVERVLRVVEAGFAKLMDVALSLVTWLPWTVLVGMLPGLIVWQLRYMGQLENVHENEINYMYTAVYSIVSSLIFFTLCAVGYLVVVRRRSPGFPEFCRNVTRFASILVVAPIYFFILPHPDNRNAPFFTILLCVIGGGTATWAAYAIPGIGKLFASREKIRRLIPMLVVTALAVTWAVILAQKAIFHHTHLGTAGWDFGLYINTMWQSLHGDPLACSLTREGTHASRHFDPILVLLSPVLLLRQGAEAEILMSLLSGWVAAGAIPLYLLAARQGRNPWMGVVLVVAYLLHPVFHGPTVYEFHSLVLGGPLMLWCMHFLEAGFFKRFFVALVLLLLTREDMSAIALLIGLYAYISNKPRRVALLAIAAPLLYGSIVYIAIFAQAISYNMYFDKVSTEDHSVLSSIALTVVTNPVHLLKYMLSEGKVVYLLQLIVPLLFLPLFSGKYRLLFLFGLLMTLTGSMSRMHSISMQYSTWWLPLMFASLPTAIDNLTRGRVARAYKLDANKLRGALLIGVLFSAFTMSVAYGIFWPNPSFRTGFTKLIRTPNAQLQASAETVAKLEKTIPRDASVLASEHIISHFSARQRIWSTEKLGYRFEEPDYGIIWSKDLRFHLHRKNKVKRRRAFMEMLRDTRKYERILYENGISVYKRKSAH
jgi:uncharacterized membrane protein